MDEVPVTLIAGYLGAGKTTWLNARIETGLPAGALILVNDFGTINVDAELIAYRDDRVLRLTNGCICCSLSESLAVQLADISRWDEPPSAIFIETSGVAEPARIADLIRVSRAYRLDEIVCLVDGANLYARLADVRVATLVEGQIVAADQLSVNRLENTTPETSAWLKDELARLNPDVFHSRHANIESSTARTFIPAAPTGRDSHRPAWARFAIRFGNPINRTELETVLDRYRDVLVRAKGTLFENDRCVVFQWSGGRARWTATARTLGAGQLIGIGFEGQRFDALAAGLEAL